MLSDRQFKLYGYFALIISPSGWGLTDIMMIKFILLCYTYFFYILTCSNDATRKVKIIIDLNKKHRFALIAFNMKCDQNIM